MWGEPNQPIGVVRGLRTEAVPVRGLLPGSGGHPWPHSPPQHIHALLSATPGPRRPSASLYRGFDHQKSRWNPETTGTEALNSQTG